MIINKWCHFKDEQELHENMLQSMDLTVKCRQGEWRKLVTKWWLNFAKGNQSSFNVQRQTHKIKIWNIISRK